MVSEREEHSPQFRGVWIPAEVFQLLREKKIKAIEMTLLSIIEAYTSADRGCFASNAYLASELGVADSRIRQLLTKLRQMGLVKTTKRGPAGYREIRTAWGAVAHSANDTNGDSASSLAHTALRNKRNDRSKIDKSNKDHCEHAGDGFGLNGDKAEDFASPLVQQLHAALKKKRKIMREPNNQMWLASFRGLIQDVSDAKRVRRVLRWYCQHIGEQFVPKAFSAASFREKFIDIEDAMIRMSGEDPDKRTDGFKSEEERQQSLKKLGWTE